MNALVASVIRTYTPIIVGQVAAWLILIHIPVDPSLTVLLTALTGGALSAVYYTLIRVLEQQWPNFGILLGLTASPDTYSKGVSASPDTTPAAAAAAAATAVDVPTINTAALTDAAPATTFPKAAVDAAVAAEPAPAPAGFEAPIAPATTPTA